MSTDGYDLEQAYEIHGPEEARRMYGDWAATYDESFGRAWGYIAPREIAAILVEQIAPGTEILDIGAGTGLWPRACRARRWMPSTSRPRCWRSPAPRASTAA